MSVFLNGDGDLFLIKHSSRFHEIYVKYEFIVSCTIILVCALFIETQYPSVYHSRDVWHKAKLLKKAIAEV